MNNEVTDRKFDFHRQEGLYQLLVQQFKGEISPEAVMTASGLMNSVGRRRETMHSVLIGLIVLVRCLI